jgi:sugar phosphate isomerase/epimerase
VADGLWRLETLAAACRALGTSVITLCTGTRDPGNMWRRHPDNDRPEAWKDLLDVMERALVIAETNDVSLAIEPEQANVIHSAQRARRLLDHFGSSRLRIIMDAANLFERAAPAEIERIVEAAFDLLGDEIVMAHAKDRDAQGRFVAAGQGVLNYDHYIAQLRRIDFTGALILHSLSKDQVQSCVNLLRQKMGTD